MESFYDLINNMSSFYYLKEKNTILDKELEQQQNRVKKISNDVNEILERNNISEELNKYIEKLTEKSNNIEKDFPIINDFECVAINIVDSNSGINSIAETEAKVFIETNVEELR